MKKWILVGSLLLMFCLTASVASARVFFGFGFGGPPVFVGPPVAPPPAYAPYPYRYGPGYYDYRVWVPGYWSRVWTRYGWERVWRPGHWEYRP